MNKRVPLILGAIALLLILTGVVVSRAILSDTQSEPEIIEEELEVLPTVDPSIQISLKESAIKDHTVIISISGLKKSMANVGYELTYESEGLVKGVNSGSKPIDLVGKDSFEREIYLGTCSRNVCKADTGVTSVTLTLEFTDTSSQKSQFSNEYPL